MYFFMVISYTVLYKTDNISIIFNRHVNLTYSIQSEHYFIYINVSCAEQRSLMGTLHSCGDKRYLMYNATMTIFTIPPT